MANQQAIAVAGLAQQLVLITGLGMILLAAADALST